MRILLLSFPTLVFSKQYYREKIYYRSLPAKLIKLFLSLFFFSLSLRSGILYTRIYTYTYEIYRIYNDNLFYYHHINIGFNRDFNYAIVKCAYIIRLDTLMIDDRFKIP